MGTYLLEGGALKVKIYILTIMLVLWVSAISIPSAEIDGISDSNTKTMQVTVDGTISSGEYLHSFTKKEFTLYYSIEKDIFHFALTTNAQGWISFGFGGSGDMNNYDIITGGFDESTNTSYVFDCFSIGKVVPPPDGVQNIIEFAATQVSGITTFEGTRKLNTGDQTGDHELIPGVSTNVIFARHSTSDDISIIHNKEEKLGSVVFIGPPSAPRNLQATVGRTQVQLSWDAPLGDGGSALNNYIVYRSEDGGQTYTAITTTTSRSYTDNSVSTGTIYRYFVSATNANGESGGSNNVVALPLGQITEPTNVAATTDSFEVTLTWNSPVDDGGIPVTNYTVYRNESGNFIPIAKTDGSTFQYVDRDVINGFEYQYQVTASNLYNESAPSSIVTALPKGEPLPPVNISIVSGDNSALISWDPPITDGGFPITGYNIYRSIVSGSNYSLVASNVSTTQYLDTTALNGQTYFYAIAAINSYGESNISLEQRVLIANTPLPPTVNAVGNDSEIILTWSDADGRGFPILGYRIYRSLDQSSFSLIAETNETMFIDRDVQNGRTYYYYVSALNEVGESPYSFTVSAIPATVPSAPLNETARVADDQISVSWEKPLDNGGLPITEYHVQRKAGSESFTDYAVTYSTVFFDSNVTFGTTYIYRIAAVNERGAGPYSSSAETNLLEFPSSPYRLAGFFDNGSITLLWEFDSNESVSFNVYRTRVQGTPYVKIGSTNSTSYVDSSIELGSHYYYVVTAVNARGESDYSDQAIVSTFTVPSVPADIAIVVSPESLTLLWLPGPGFVLPADFYLVYKSTDGIAFTLVGNTTDLFYIDTEVELNQTYYYFIVAVNEFGNSDPSETVSGTIPESIPEVEIPSTGDENTIYKDDLNMGQILGTAYVFLGIGAVTTIFMIVRKRLGL